MSLEREFWSGLPEFYESRLAEQCRMIFPGVGILSREAAIEGVSSGARWSSVDITDSEVTELESGLALVSYSASASRGSEAERYRVRVGSVYVEKPDGWKLAFHQHTLVGAGSGS